MQPIVRLIFFEIRGLINVEGLSEEESREKRTKKTKMVGD